MKLRNSYFSQDFRREFPAVHIIMLSSQMQVFLILNQNITIFSQCSAAAGVSLADYFSQCPVLFIDLICSYLCVLTEDFEPIGLIILIQTAYDLCVHLKY